MTPDRQAQDVVEGRITASRERVWTRSGSASFGQDALSETGRATSNVIPIPTEIPFGDELDSSWFGG
jgi:hypothetical protein